MFPKTLLNHSRELKILLSLEYSFTQKCVFHMFTSPEVSDLDYMDLYLFKVLPLERYFPISLLRWGMSVHISKKWVCCVVSIFLYPSVLYARHNISTPGAWTLKEFGTDIVLQRTNPYYLDTPTFPLPPP